MTTPNCTMPSPDLSGAAALPSGSGLSRVHADERGAILVLGIFMCACMVGMLWYVAGIGDAIIYRERMQAGADAAAFSGAVLHARGMNLIVLLNLIMACILAIRVALRVAAVVLFVVGAILAWIPGAQGLSTLAFQAGARAEQTAQQTRQVINRAISALSTVQRGIARIVPPASIVGSFQVGMRYRPIVSGSAAGSPTTVKDGLPVTDGSEDKLCEMAGRAVGAILTWKAPIPSGVANRVEGLLGKAIRAGGAYFCEIGSGGSPPDFSDELNAGAEEGCDKEQEELANKARAAELKYQDACTSFGASCAPLGGTGATLTPAQQAELAQLEAERNNAVRAHRDFDHDDCVRARKREVKDQFDEATAGANTESASGQGMTPKKMAADWKNGVNDAQVIAVAVGNQESLSRAPKGVVAGAWRTRVDIKVPTTARFALAQAEFYFDCSGRWENNDCHGTNADNADTLWKFRWRARLRRFNTPFAGDSAGLENVAGLLAGAEALQLAIFSFSPDSLTFQNARVLAELGRAARDPKELIIH